MKDAAGNDRMMLDTKPGWAAVGDWEVGGGCVLTVSDGDGYTLPQSVILSEADKLALIEYLSWGVNPRP